AGERGERLARAESRGDEDGRLLREHGTETGGDVDGRGPQERPSPVRLDPHDVVVVVVDHPGERVHPRGDEPPRERDRGPVARRSLELRERAVDVADALTDAGERVHERGITAWAHAPVRRPDRGRERTDRALERIRRRL